MHEPRRSSVSALSGFARVHDLRFCYPETLKNVRTTCRVIGDDELVDLRWLDAGAGQHGMGLAAVMSLVLEEVGEHVVAALHLDATCAVNPHRAVEVFIV